jgi:LAO/AO transport system kinase
LDLDSLTARVLAGERRAVARIISLVEDGGDEIGRIMSDLYPHTGKAYSVGVTGAPGAGKSSLVERLVTRARAERRKVGVLAVDPSSPFSGGALLGDRVRMQNHATDGDVFIRSMASRGHLGGISLATPEAVRVLDAAGSDIVIIETVGVGQAEVEITDACDTTVVVVTPGWGDAVQAAKAGLMEIADVFVVNKADRPGVRETVRELRQILDLAPSDWRPEIVETVATKGEGTDELWAAIGKHRRHQEANGLLEARRRRRLEREIREIVAERSRRRVDAEAGQFLSELTREVAARRLDPYVAATKLMKSLPQTVEWSSDAPNRRSQTQSARP